MAPKTKQLSLEELRAAKKEAQKNHKALVKAEDAAITAVDKNLQLIQSLDERIRYFVGEDLGRE